MKNVSKKVICALSSAILLCGASAISASAATTTAYNSSASSRLVTTTAKTPSLPSVKWTGFYSLNRTVFEGTLSEMIPLEVIGSSTKGARVSYQWYDGNGIISGATSSTYTPDASGTYYCKVTESVVLTVRTNGKLQRFLRQKEYTTNSAKVIVIADLSITKQPQDGYISGNSKPTLNLAVTGGTRPYSVEWTDEAGNVVSTRAPYRPDKVGTYKCTITDRKGRKVESNPAVVRYSPLEFKTAPSSDYSLTDTYNKYTISAEAKGSTGNYTIEWQEYESTHYYNGYSIPGGWHRIKYDNSIDVDINDQFEWGEYRNARAYYYGRGEYFTGYYYADLYVYNEYRCIIRSYDENGNKVDEKIKEFKVYKLGQKDVEVDYTTYAKVKGYM